MAERAADYGAMRHELVATRNLAAELRRRVAAQEVELEQLRAELLGTLPPARLPSDKVPSAGLQDAIRDFASTAAKRRVLAGLTWRVLLGRTSDARQRVEQMLREHGVPAELAQVADWIGKPRAVLGLARRRAIGGRASVEGLLVLALERDFAAQQRRIVAAHYAETSYQRTAGSTSAAGLRRAIRDFARAIARWPMICGLAGRTMLGRAANVRLVVEALLLESGMPSDMASAAMWIAKPRVILGLARRWAVAGGPSVEGLLVLALERQFNVET